tara:strand:+ start:332 stop:745 length:414 start_codon:yes stop_codon:yes gene_type:complete
MYVNLWDKFEGDFDAGVNDRPLIALRNQQTNKTKYFIAQTALYTNKQRYVQLRFTLNFEDGDLPIIGLVYLGTKEYPYGLYDITMWQNTSGINLDPSGLNLLYKGLANLIAVGNDSVEYTEYENTQQSNVYITNTYI